MKKLHFNYLKAENFLCYGPEGIEIRLHQLGNIVFVQGENLDAPDRNSKDESNGVGKSALAEIIVYTLYGKTIKKPKKIKDGHVINNVAGRKLWTEVRFDKYRVVRQREPNRLQVWSSDEGVWTKDTEITKGTMMATQELVENLLGMTYESFVNVVVFSDDNTASFLECDGPTKRQIVENLLGLEKYRNYHANARDLYKKCKESVKTLAHEYELLVANVDHGIRQIDDFKNQEKDWKVAKAEEFKRLLATIEQRQKMLSESSDTGAALLKYNHAQEEMAELREQLPDLQTQRDSLAAVVKDIGDKMDQVFKDLEVIRKSKSEVDAQIASHDAEIGRHRTTLLQLEQRTGKIDCPYCYGKIDRKNFKHVVEEADKAIAEQEALKEELTGKAESLKKKLDSFQNVKDKGVGILQKRREELSTADRAISTANSKISQLAAIKEPKAGVDEFLLMDQIEELRKQASAKQAEMEGPTPYAAILAKAQEDTKAASATCRAKKIQCDKVQADLPYYDYWVKSFGETGIRKYVIEGMLPALNARISFWLQFLIDNKIKLTFNSEFDETIDRYPFEGRPYVYHCMSGGQRRRLILALSQAFAYIRLLNAGASPSLVFLDEVTMNMDRAGVEGIYRMICELSKERQVFVIDHNAALMQMLDGCEKIYLQMKGGVTKQVSR